MKAILHTQTIFASNSKITNKKLIKIKNNRLIKIHDILRVTHLLFNRLLINYLPKLLLFLTNI